MPVDDSPIEQIDGAYDVVTVLSVLEHVNRPREFLRQVSRLLAPGGATYLIVPNVDSLATRVLHERAATFDGRNHLLYFSPATLSRSARAGGLRRRRACGRGSPRSIRCSNG